MLGLCCRRRGPGPDVLNDQPVPVELTPEDDDVAAFGCDLSAGRNRRQGLLEVPAIVSEIAGSFEVLAVECEVAVEAGHYILEERAKRRGARDAFACRLQKNRVGSIELQDRFELLGAKILDPGFAKSGEGYKSRGLGRRSGVGREGWREEGGE